MTKLSGAEIPVLSRVLASTLDEADLESLVYASTGDRLYDEYVARGDPKRKTIEKLLNALENSGSTPLFLSAVYELRHERRPDVAQEIRRVCPEAAKRRPAVGAKIQVQTAGLIQKDSPEWAAAPGFERNIRPNLPQLDLHIWLEKLARIERQVCRVERNGNAAGTGFLVGPDAVLTNWHVVEEAKRAGTMHAVSCRFDYLRLADGSRQPGISVGLDQAGCVSFGRYSAAELTQTPDNPEPTTDELDYALLRLERPIGRDDIGGGRGCIKLPETEMLMRPGDPLLIVQHPDGSPMKLALDTQAILELNANRTRVRYTTNTESGSSGSPCLTLNWDLVALHHYGDPAWGKPVYNQGIPAQLIRRKISEEGFAELLGG